MTIIPNLTVMVVFNVIDIIALTIDVIIITITVTLTFNITLILVVVGGRIIIIAVTV